MKHTIPRFLLSFLMVCALLVSTISPAFAYDPYVDGGVVIEGTGRDNLILEASNDCFSSQSLVCPGDFWSSTITLKNNSFSKDDVYIRLTSIESLLEDDTLFDAMTLKVLCDDECLYSGPYNELLSTEYFRLKPKEEINLLVIMGLPSAVTNYAQGKEMSSLWHFDAKYEAPEDDDFYRFYTYIVQYVDSEGNVLHEEKINKAPLNTIVTEYPVDIKGYYPLNDSLSLVISRNEKQNVITFVYAKDKLPDQPDQPGGTDTPDIPDNPDNPDNPNTPDNPNPSQKPSKPGGNVATGNDKDIAPFFYLIGGSCILLIVLLIVRKKTDEEDKKRNRKS